MAEYSVIADRDAFLAACEALASGTGPAAVDVERASGFRYSQRAYLIQVFRRDAGVFLFDPPAIGDFGALQRAIGDVEWVFHAASQDLPSLRELDLVPDRLFDTELAVDGWPVARTRIRIAGCDGLADSSFADRDGVETTALDLGWFLVRLIAPVAGDYQMTDDSEIRIPWGDLYGWYWDRGLAPGAP